MSLKTQATQKDWAKTPVLDVHALAGSDACMSGPQDYKFASSTSLRRKCPTPHCLYKRIFPAVCSDSPPIMKMRAKQKDQIHLSVLDVQAVARLDAYLPAPQMRVEGPAE
eukprot:337122-Pelagomonas_calceolata.AAC.4